MNRRDLFRNALAVAVSAALRGGDIVGGIIADLEGTSSRMVLTPDLIMREAYRQLRHAGALLATNRQNVGTTLRVRVPERYRTVTLRDRA